jgi:hypothetical protein
MVQLRSLHRDGASGLHHEGWFALAILAAATAAVGALVLLRRDPEASARWPLPAPALAAGFVDLHPDGWEAADSAAGPGTCGDVQLLTPDPYHASLRSPGPARAA